jgi:uncharacterized RDD family membrane protein YckC
MTLVRKIVFAAVLSLLGFVSVGAIVAAQTVRIGDDRYFRIGGRQAVRLWQDFTLKPEETARDVFVLSGTTTIAGTIEGDLVVVLGPVRLEKTARIRGSVSVTAGDITVIEGARVDRDFIVVGGGADLPASFFPGGEHVAIGNPWVSARLRDIAPWVTYGLLWGRLIVFSIPWVWWFVGISLIVSLAISLVLHSPVSQTADTLASRPAGSFVTGLLMLLLTGPIAVLLAATVIGLAIVPFFLCATIVAWIVGKVAVARWIGRTILGHGSEETNLEGLTAVLVGFASVCLLYAVPIVGLMTWALIGVLGLGSATLTVLAALRRERAKRRPKTEPPPVPPAPPSTFDREAPPAPVAPAMPMMASAVPPRAYDPPPMTAQPLDAPPPPMPRGPAVSAAGVAMSLATRATFLDRVVAGVLDMLFVVFVFNVFLDRLFWHEQPVIFFLFFAYFVTFWSWKGTTLGGMVCNLRVVRSNGAPLAGSDAVVRGLACVFSFVPLGLGFLWILRDPQNQAWHDKIAGTIVLKDPSSPLAANGSVTPESRQPR